MLFLLFGFTCVLIFTYMDKKLQKDIDRNAVLHIIKTYTPKRQQPFDYQTTVRVKAVKATNQPSGKLKQNENHNLKKQQSIKYQPTLKVNAVNVTNQPSGKLKHLAKSKHVEYKEESCDIETERYYFQHRKKKTNLFINFTPIGGSDWRFLSTIHCVDLNETIFTKSKEERKHLTPKCSYNAVYLESKNHSKDIPIFQFPDKCLKRVISKFCTDKSTVPNIVHYIWLGKREFEFIYFVSFYSTHKNQKPCLIFLYFDILPFGKWWDILPKFVNNIVYIKITPPTEISGKKVKWVEHKSDIMRLKILKEYGGIYLDTDQYVLRSLNEFRNKDCTMGMGHDGAMASALIIAAKNSTFINIWIDSYKSYNPNIWGANSVTMARILCRKYPQHVFVHEHHCLFFPHGSVLYDQNYKWSHSYGLHLYSKVTRKKEVQKWNLVTIRKLNNTIGAVFRYVLFGSKELCD
ncbi:uncharacterized protein LOC133202753 [Saccostrea echinata]|uniref:uncharacterized protein LOC133202753 n=1 Tax=Saccostrea echinata TaxID=191078 RepID=UPI002A812A95|nr:uncharacterized protein LOC133202753 [Saccostrea echinata]